MKTHELQPESIFYKTMINVFAEVFNSEMLYCVWDIIIFEIIKCRNTVNRC